MADTTHKPVIFLAFANDRDETVGYLRNLPDEARRLREVLGPAEQAGLCEVVVRSNSTAADIFKVFQDPRYRNRVGVFHYGGHANGYELLLESSTGQSAAADAGGLAAFLAQQQGLQLVFLNGCSTLQQTQALLDANVSAVISTSRAIEDRVAMDFATQFYQGLGGGAGLQKAFDEAAAAVSTTQGSDTRGLYLDDSSKVSDTFDGDRLPWLLSYRPGVSQVADWNLPNAVDDPLFGLPPLPDLDLPESPYRHLKWFTQDDARIYFGRGRQIRELYDRLTGPRTAPIMLFYGQSGVGKSSILDAGLIPRLKHDYAVSYVRRGDAGLLNALQSAILPEARDLPIDEAWQEYEKQSGKPLIVFLDQVEEFFTRPIESLPEELDQLLEALQTTFVNTDQRPRGRLVLSFRKEWLAELETRLVSFELPRSKKFLEPLDRRGIIEVVQGPAQSIDLREHYGLTVEEGLPEMIADDLLADRDSAIAPTLQILLTKLWGKATEENYEHPCFTRDLYNDLKRDGILLRDFLNQQIAAFRQRYPDAVDSGLLLDIVALHTTPLGTANQRTVEQLQEQYAHLGVTLPELLQQCQDLHLLTVAASSRKSSTKTTRLAHDTLAPLVREQFDESDKPGQRARRILDNRSVDWANDHVGAPLDDADLKVVEAGARGTRALTANEKRLLEASRSERRKRIRIQRTLQIVGSVAVVLITVLFGLASSERNKARTNLKQAEANLVVARQAVDELLAQVGSESLKDVPQLEQVREALLTKATELYRQLAVQQTDGQSLGREQALAHFSLGEIHRIQNQRQGAIAEYRAAADQLATLLTQPGAGPELRLDLARIDNKYGWMLSQSTEPADRHQAEALYGKALEQFALLSDSERGQPEFQAEQALTLNNRGVLRKHLKDFERAREDFDSVIALLAPFEDQPASPENRVCQLYLAYGYMNRAMLKPESIADGEKAIQIAKSMKETFPKDREILTNLASWYNNLAGVQIERKNVEEAQTLSANALEILQELQQPTPRVRYEFGNWQITRAAIALENRDLKDAYEAKQATQAAEQATQTAKLATQAAKEIFERLSEDDKQNANYDQGLKMVEMYESAVKQIESMLEEFESTPEEVKPTLVDQQP